MRLSPRRRDGGPNWLRLSSFGAAPAEHVLRPTVASSLFPLIPQHSRGPFRLGLGVLVGVLLVFAAVRWQAPLIAVAALGLPALLVIYLAESDAFHDLSVGVLILNAALGIAGGVGWAMLTRDVAARFYSGPLGSAVTAESVLLVGLAIPVGGAILMTVPAVVVRLRAPADRESLDGFVIGMLGATSFTAAATLTRLAPQFPTGVVADGRPVGGLIVEAGICGVTMPLVAAALGGTVGTALWFRRKPNASGRRWMYRAVFATAVVTLLCGYVALGVTDIARLPQSVQLGFYVVDSAIALVVLRLVMQAALLHEHQDPAHMDEPLLCPHCEHVVPDMAFCPNCGAAAKASSRSSRTPLRQVRPVPAERPSGES